MCGDGSKPGSTLGSLRPAVPPWNGRVLRASARNPVTEMLGPLGSSSPRGQGHLFPPCSAETLTCLFDNYFPPFNFFSLNQPPLKIFITNCQPHVQIKWLLSLGNLTFKDIVRSKWNERPWKRPTWSWAQSDWPLGKCGTIPAPTPNSSKPVKAEETPQFFVWKAFYNPQFE